MRSGHWLARLGQLQDFTPSNFVVGTADLNGRRVVIGGDDFTVRGGAADAKVGDKSRYGERYALEMRLPLVRLVDGSGDGGSVKTLEMVGHSYGPATPHAMADKVSGSARAKLTGEQPRAELYLHTVGN